MGVFFHCVHFCFGLWFYFMCAKFGNFIGIDKKFHLRFASLKKKYNDVIASAMASQITGVSIVCSTVVFRRRSMNTSKLRVIGLCAGNSPMTGEFPAQKTVTRKMFPFDDVIVILYRQQLDVNGVATVHMMTLGRFLINRLLWGESTVQGWIPIGAELSTLLWRHPDGVYNNVSYFTVVL